MASKPTLGQADIDRRAAEIADRIRREVLPMRLGMSDWDGRAH